MNLLAQNYTFTLNGGLIMILIFGLLIIQIFFIIYISYLVNKLKQYQSPKFGFLGKPLYPLIIIALLGVSIFSLNYLPGKKEIITIKASKTIEADIDEQILQAGVEIVKVNYKIIPKVDGKTWGNETDKFDIFWKISGAEEKNIIEVGKNINDQSNIFVDLKRGEYEIEANIVFEGKTYKFTKTSSF